MHALLHACIHTCMHACIGFACVHVIDACMHADTCMHVIDMCMHACACIYQLHARMHGCTWLRACMHTSTVHACVHVIGTCMHVCTPLVHFCLNGYWMKILDLRSFSLLWYLRLVGTFLKPILAAYHPTTRTDPYWMFAFACARLYVIIDACACVAAHWWWYTTRSSPHSYMCALATLWLLHAC